MKNDEIKNITMYSTSWCPDCARAKAFFAEYNIDYREVNIEENPEFVQLVEKINNGNRSVPTIVYSTNGSEKSITEPNRDVLSNLFLK